MTKPGVPRPARCSARALTALPTVEVEALAFLMILSSTLTGRRIMVGAEPVRPKELNLTRRGVAVELAADRLFLPAEPRRVLLQQLALCAQETSGVILPHLLL